MSSWRASDSLDAYLRERGVVGIDGLESRALVRHLRSQGAMRGALSNLDDDADRLVELARRSPSTTGADLVCRVSCARPYEWSADGAHPAPGDGARPAGAHPASSSAGFHVVVCDYGVKRNTLRLLASRGCRVTVVPACTSAQEVLAFEPDGVLLSNGPGDPAAVTYAVECVGGLLGRVPIMGICLGHQILGLALGGDTYKLKFGHRGVNQPVKNLQTGQVAITTHNHGFAVRAESLPREVQVTHVNLNDQCVEGLRSRELCAFSVQFHPEAAPGPHDAMNLFDEFIALMRSP